MLSVRIKVRLRVFEARCPSCNSSDIRPGMIRPWVEGVILRTLLFLTFRRPYLCRNCDARFYDFRTKARHLATDDPEIQTLLRDYCPPLDDAAAADQSERVALDEQTEQPKKDRTA